MIKITNLVFKLTSDLVGRDKWKEHMKRKGINPIYFVNLTELEDIFNKNIKPYLGWVYKNLYELFQDFKHDFPLK